MGQRRVFRGAGLLMASLLLGGTTTLTGAGTAGADQPAPGITSAPVEVRAGAETSPVPRRRATDWVAYAVPTSAAGLGRIRTAPDGAMWFVMEDANKIGRITTGGVVTEFNLPPTTTGEGTVEDLTISADGSVWVVYDTGWMALRFHPDNPGGATGYALGAYPYGEQIEMGPDGAAWVTMRYDRQGVARLLPDGSGVWHPNAPECERAIGRADDGTMWCQDWDGLIALNGDASGGMRFPLPSNATYPYSVAAGPTGSIWFARHSGGTMFTSPGRGDVGWLNRADGQATLFNTGLRTAPLSLVPGPGGTMWFTSIGAAKGVGHLDAQGRGALTKVAEYEPRYLTFGPDGNVWFTDETNNVVVRVNRSALGVTNVDPGVGSVFKIGDQPPGAGPKPTANKVGTVAVGKKPLKVRKNRVRVPISCPKSSKTRCQGKAVLRHQKKSTRFSTAQGYTVKAGKKKTVALKLTKKGRRAITRKPLKVRATLLARQGTGTRDKMIRIRR